jgi:RNA polymerase sigma-70 factor (ECF subfamily)
MDHVGFETFYRSEHARVLAVVVAVTGRRDVADDAAGEAFARALARWGRVSKMATPGAWTATVALNVARRTLGRAARERVGVTETTARAVAAPPDPELWDLVRALPVRQRTAVVLRYAGDFTHAEIAQAMRVRVGTVGSTLDAAHRNLRSALSQEEAGFHGRA